MEVNQDSPRASFAGFDEVTDWPPAYLAKLLALALRRPESAPAARWLTSGPPGSSEANSAPSSRIVMFGGNRHAGRADAEFIPTVYKAPACTLIEGGATERHAATGEAWRPVEIKIKHRAIMLGDWPTATTAKISRLPKKKDRRRPKREVMKLGSVSLQLRKISSLAGLVVPIGLLKKAQAFESESAGRRERAHTAAVKASRRKRAHRR
jgi:hypothetical protein